MKNFKEFKKQIEEQTITDQLLKDVRQASLIKNSSLFKDKVQSNLKEMSAKEIEQVLAKVKWPTAGLLFKGWLQAVLKVKLKTEGK